MQKHMLEIILIFESLTHMVLLDTLELSSKKTIHLPAIESEQSIFSMQVEATLYSWTLSFFTLMLQEIINMGEVNKME